MKMVSKLSFALVALAFVGVGCSASGTTAVDGTGAPAAATAPAAKSGKAVVSAKLTAAGIAFTEKDKTAASKVLFAEDCIVAVTEFKITGTGVIVSVVDTTDAGGAGLAGAKQLAIFNDVVVKAAPSYQQKAVFSVNPTSAVQLIFKAEDAATVTKVNDALRK